MNDHQDDPVRRRPAMSGPLRNRPGSGNSSLADAVYDRIIEEINAGSLRPGDALREIELSERFGVSRTPVREALHRLEVEEALVKRDRGLIVPLVDDKQILELYAMREVLEGAAAGLAARSASENEIFGIGQILSLATEANSIPPERQTMINAEFHSAIYRAANNRYLCKSLYHLRDAVGRLQKSTFSVPGRAKTALREHRAIHRAIAKHDAEAAEAAARHHIREALRCRMLLLHQGRQKLAAG